METEDALRIYVHLSLFAAHHCVSSDRLNQMPQAAWLQPREFIFSYFWRLEAQDQSVGREVSSEASLLGLQMAAHCCVLTWSFLCVHASPVCLFVPKFLLVRTPGSLH